MLWRDIKSIKKDPNQTSRNTKYYISEVKNTLDGINVTSVKRKD